MYKIVNSEYQLNFLERLVTNALKCGPIPEHIAVIMDGNRRYGKREHIKSRSAYMKGFKVISYVNSICIAIGVKQVTIYTFSIENFKRSQEEVSVVLDDLFVKILQTILEDIDVNRKNGIRYRIIGNLSLLSEKCQITIKEVHKLTRDNNTFILNLAVAYTSRDEISNAIKTVVEEVNCNEINSTDIDEGTIQRHLYLPDQVDCLVRTSGEVRFSDFLLWQIGQAQIHFYDMLWPEFGPISFVKFILNYQKIFTRVKNFPPRNNNYDGATEIQENTIIH